MTSPWKYSGQSVPQGKPPAGTASTEHPARMVASLVSTSTPSRKGTQAENAIAQEQATVRGPKAKHTEGATPRRLWPTTNAVDSADGQVQLLPAPKNRNKSRTSLAAAAAGLQSRASVSHPTVPVDDNCSTQVQQRSILRRSVSSSSSKRGAPQASGPGSDVKEKGAYPMATRLFELACSTGLVMGSTMLINELVLPKIRFTMPDIIYGFKTLMRSLRAAAMRSAENGARLAGGYPKATSA